MTLKVIFACAEHTERTPTCRRRKRCDLFKFMIKALRHPRLQVPLRSLHQVNNPWTPLSATPVHSAQASQTMRTTNARHCLKWLSTHAMHENHGNNTNKHNEQSQCDHAIWSIFPTFLTFFQPQPKGSVAPTPQPCMKTALTAPHFRNEKAMQFTTINLLSKAFNYPVHPTNLICFLGS